LRPDDGPVQRPKHVVLVINTPLCFDCTILYHLIVSNTTGMSQYSLQFQCGSGTWCSSLNLTGVLGKKFGPKHMGLRHKDISLGEIYSSLMFDFTCEACGPFIVSYWRAVDLVHAI